MIVRLKAPTSDWTDAGAVHMRINLLKQMLVNLWWSTFCNNEDMNVRMLFLLVGSKDLEINNTATWAAFAYNLRLNPVLAALEAYTKP